MPRPRLLRSLSVRDGVAALVVIATAASCNASETAGPKDVHIAEAAAPTPVQPDLPSVEAPAPKPADAELQNVSTASWEVELPADWTEKPGIPSGPVYFESADATKGMYVANWLNDDWKTPKAAAEIVRKANEAEFFAQAGSSWRLVDEHASHIDGRSIVVTDYVDDASKTRIVAKLIARPGSVISATFHDYACESYEASQKSFQPIINSMRPVPLH